MSKYNARKVRLDGYTFDSEAEARRYGELKLLAQAGEIFALEVHPRFVLLDGFLHWGERVRKIEYVADFAYNEVDPLATANPRLPVMRRVVEDVKGVKTQVYQLKVKLFKKRYPLLLFREVRA